MNSDNTNWEQSVAGVVIHDGKVLLARHTYGPGKGRLIIPGRYVNISSLHRRAFYDLTLPQELFYPAVPVHYRGDSRA